MTATYIHLGLIILFHHRHACKAVERFILYLVIYFQVMERYVSDYKKLDLQGVSHPQEFALRKRPSHAG